MQLNRFYYTIKPFIPPPMRLAVRRWWTNRRIADYQNVWPIKESAAAAPQGWPGWPDGKKFAVVLTHDVEGKRGLDRVRSLYQLEVSLGFRSAFNLIPEGEYKAPRELREELAHAGFEVGIHDLRHDGKLYRSRTEFTEQAKRINHYLAEWKAVGFRSGFMLRNLSWLSELNIEYDGSTFDTDPFEPQPDGADTIFPFWIPKAKSDGQGGYIELPYTLPQDSTLFRLLQQKTIETWTRKLDWIAQHGGMALINVHPDYVHFANERVSRGEVSVDFYRQFLQYVKTNYADQYWPALPREVAEYAAPLRPQRANRAKKRVCMLAYTFYESDNRVRRYTESLVRRGDRVDVVALRRDSTAGEKYPDNLKVYGLQERIHNEKGKLSYLNRLVRFCLSSATFLARASRQEPYDLVHVHNIPDFLVFSALLPKLRGAKVILDIHDVVPEFYASKFHVAERSPVIKLLRFVEKRAARFADHIIISNHLWYDKITGRSIAPQRCSPFINYVDPTVFYRRSRNRRDGKFLILFPGGLQWHQGLDIAIKAFGLIRDKAPEAEFHIYGEGNAKGSLIELVNELGLEKRILFFPPRSLNEIAEIVANADLGVVPKRANSFGNEAYSTKIMEFMSQGVPMIVSRTKIDCYYFNDQVVRFFESENVEDLADAMLTLIRNQPLRETLARNALVYADENSWARREREYFNLVDSLTA
jgi:glycosyltransferase involved in cell wall biosynthesis